MRLCSDETYTIVNIYIIYENGLQKALYAFDARVTYSSVHAIIYKIKGGKTMITIFNRRELCLTYSFEQQADLRACLAAEGIHYQMKTTNCCDSGGFASRSGAFISRGLGVNMQHDYEYKFYVNKRDIEQAKHLIGKTAR